MGKKKANHYLDIGLQGMLIPGGIWRKGHESICCANMRPIYTTYAMKLDLYIKKSIISATNLMARRPRFH